MGKRSGKRPRFNRLALVARRTMLFALLTSHSLADDSAIPAVRSVAIWGSSVASGVGDETQSSGYLRGLREVLDGRGWQVLDRSRPGDNSITIQPRFMPSDSKDPAVTYLIDPKPDMVVIALSLGNEGVAQCQMGQSARCTRSQEAAEQVVAGYLSNLRMLVAKARSAGIIPVVTLPYARLDFSEREYALTRRTNLIMNDWDVPTVNLLGALDDGQGRWPRGFWADPFHPNAAGYRELAYAFVPSLFDALASDKPSPRKSPLMGYAHIPQHERALLRFENTDAMHSFSVSFQFRANTTGVLASFDGRQLSASFQPYRRSYGDFSWDTEAVQLQPLAGDIARYVVFDGREIRYQGESGGHALSTTLSDGSQWHDVTVSHSSARGVTQFYVDGEIIGTLYELLAPTAFSLGGAITGSRPILGAAADFREWMIHRAALNGDEVSALHRGVLLPASLELYAPLGHSIENTAQSQSVLSMETDEIRFIADQ